MERCGNVNIRSGTRVCGGVVVQRKRAACACDAQARCGSVQKRAAHNAGKGPNGACVVTRINAADRGGGNNVCVYVRSGE